MIFDDKTTRIDKYAKKRNSTKIVAMINDSNPEIRIQAIKALGAIGDDTAINALINHLSDSDPITRLEVIKTMGTMENQTIKTHLQHLIQVETDEDIKQVIRDSITEIPDTNYGSKQYK